MSKLHKLKVTWYSRNPDDEFICDFEGAKEVVFGQGLDVIIFYL